MDKSFTTGNKTKEQGGFQLWLCVLKGILVRLVALFQLTEEEQKDAGIRLDDPDDKRQMVSADFGNSLAGRYVNQFDMHRRGTA